MGKKTNIFTEKRVDHQTGELIETKWITKEVATKDKFVALYIEHISMMNKLPYSEMKFLLCCAGVIEWNTNDLVLGPKVVEQLCSCSGLQMTTIRNAISSLSKKNFLKKKQSNWYILNPEIFFYGKEIERATMFELTYQWKIKD